MIHLLGKEKLELMSFSIRSQFNIYHDLTNHRILLFIQDVQNKNIEIGLILLIHEYYYYQRFLDLPENDAI